MASGRGSSLKRGSRTLLFMAMMAGSLLPSSSAPLLVCALDVLVPWALLSASTSCSCFWSAGYSFHESLFDIPILSLLRTLPIFCAYCICGMPRFSYSPYLGTATIGGLFSAVLLIIKASVFTLSNRWSKPSPGQPPLHSKHTLGSFSSLFLSSIFLALGHIVVAYRFRCQARQKIFYHSFDVEAVLTCKGGAHHGGLPKLTCSSVSLSLMEKMRMRATSSLKQDMDVPAHTLSEADSCFMPCEGLLLHYKTCRGGFMCTDSKRESECETKRLANVLQSVIKGSHLKRSINSTDLCTLLRSSFSKTSDSSQSFNSEKSQLECNSPVIEGNRKKMVQKIGKVGQSRGIVFIHGFGGGVYSWRHIMHPLAKQVGCFVASFDRPGWGLTSRPSHSEWERKGKNPYELYTQVDLLFAFCQELGLTSIILVGHDDGGLLALMAAAKSRTHSCTHLEVKGVVLIGVSLCREVVPTFARVLLHTSLGHNTIRSLLRSEIGQVSNRRAWYDSSKLTPDVLDLYKASLRVEGWDKALANICKVSSGTALSASQVSEVLKPLQDLPALLVSGDQDTLAPLTTTESLLTRLPCSKLVAIPSCGHLPHEESPEALLAALLPFISCLLSDSQAIWKEL